MQWDSFRKKADTYIQINVYDKFRDSPEVIEMLLENIRKLEDGPSMGFIDESSYFHSDNKDKINANYNNTDFLAPKPCLIQTSLSDKENKMFDLISKYPFWIYDRCTRRRMSEAFEHDDATFFRDLGNSILTYSENLKKETELDLKTLNRLRNFIQELDMLNLIDTEKMEDSEIQKAYDIVHEIINASPKTLNYSECLRSFKKFKEKYLEWIKKERPINKS